MVDTIRRPDEGVPDAPVMDVETFRDYVLGFLKRRNPDRDFQPTDDPQMLALGEAKIGLQNLYRNYRQLAESGKPFEEIVAEHFTQLFAGADQWMRSKPVPWETARDRLRLQLMPAEHADKASLLTFPFLDDVLIGIVADSDAGYAFVREEDAQAWGKTPHEIYEIAEENLSEASKGMEIVYVPLPDALIIVQTMDGYDAARILLPRVRELALDKLGDDVMAGIPNRDFLILWSAKNGEEFQQAVRAQIAKDAVEQSHPLTGTVLSVTAEGVAPAG